MYEMWQESAKFFKNNAQQLLELEDNLRIAIAKARKALASKIPSDASDADVIKLCMCEVGESELADVRKELSISNLHRKKLQIDSALDASKCVTSSSFMSS